MAIKFKEINDKLLLTPLTELELERVDEVEKMVDEIITNKYEGSKIYIELKLVKFYHDKEGRSSKTPYPRQQIQFKELTKRYKEAGWKTVEEFSDGMGSDYWTLEGRAFNK